MLAYSQDSNGGVFNVASGSSATFGNLIAFDGNTVTAGNSGGAVYAGGEVTALLNHRKLYTFQNGRIIL